MFSLVAGIGLGTSFPPTVILCFTSFTISPSTAPGLLTRQPHMNNREPANRRFQAAGMSFLPYSLIPPSALGLPVVSRGRPGIALLSATVRWRRLVTAEMSIFKG